MARYDPLGKAIKEAARRLPLASEKKQNRKNLDMSGSSPENEIGECYEHSPTTGRGGWWGHFAYRMVGGLYHVPVSQATAHQGCTVVLS
jgi:hypothetical protein